MSKYLDEDDIVDFTADIKTLSDATYEPKKLVFNNVTVPTSAFDQNNNNFVVNITINQESQTAVNYLIIDQSVFIPHFVAAARSKNLPDGTYSVAPNAYFVISPGNIKTDEIEWDSTNRIYTVSSWGLTINHNSYTPDEIMFYIDYIQPHIVSTYDDYPCRATVSLTGVTASTYSEVIFSLNDAVGGNFAPICETYAGGIYLYASEIPSSSMTIPSIICFN